MSCVFIVSVTAVCHQECGPIITVRHYPLECQGGSLEPRFQYDILRAKCSEGVMGEDACI